jgi:hypothetical protein
MDGGNRTPQAADLLGALAEQNGERAKREAEAAARALAKELESLRLAVGTPGEEVAEQLRGAFKARLAPRSTAALIDQYREVISRGAAEAGVDPDSVLSSLSDALQVDPARWQPSELFGGSLGPYRSQHVHTDLWDPSEGGE